uniref:Uncharacterized protein n=1 Tax=Rhipicephalus microplus TaxID=6941 RepID=A0A6M2D9X8_RHIMP
MLSVHLLLNFLRHLAPCAIGVLVFHGISYGPLRLQQERLYFSSIKVRHSKCSSNEIYPDPHRILYNVTKVTMTKHTIQLKRRLRRLTAEVCNRRPTYEAWFSTFILLYFYTRTLPLAVGAGTKPLPTSEE